jgi:diguanylate cyclase (GGDEF)-like protein
MRTARGVDGQNMRFKRVARSFVHSVDEAGAGQPGLPAPAASSDLPHGAPSGFDPMPGRTRILIRRTLALVLRHALSLRVMVALAASLGFLMVASELFFTRVASRELIQQDARGYVADATALETAFQEGSDPADSLDDVLDLIDSMEDRLGITSASLLNAQGKVVSAPRDTTLGSDRGTKLNSGTGPSYADVETREVGGGFRFVVPIHLAGEPFVLRVDANGQVLHGRVDALSNEALAFSVISMLIGIGLFYVLGGRKLARRHRLVVRRATRDSLTDLGNHGAFQDELARAVAVAARRREPFALALIDLDDFKFTNDRYGHRRGDRVLVEVARVLADGRAEDRAFRLGGDEFALLMPGTDGVGARAGIERRLAAARKNASATSFTVGVAVVPAGTETDAAVLWEQADAALYEGKRSGSGTVVVFDDVAELLSIVTPSKIQALRALLEEPRVEIVFQPIWDLQDGRVLGLEALARPWVGYGFDGPADMFTVAEKIGRAHELDAICRSAALARAHEIPKGVLLFLNVNPQSLSHGELAGDRLLRPVAAAGLKPSQVVLEITERSDARLSQVVADGTRLRSLGFRLALDDVGAGNAGLAMLRELPVDFVKIDRTVIAAALQETHAHAVLLAIVAYARTAGSYVIAEGIESEQILAFVHSAEVTAKSHEPPIKGGQGFLLGRPSSDITLLTAPVQSKSRRLAVHETPHGDPEALLEGDARRSKALR